VLETANGELYADREISLYVERLGEHISSLALPSTPHVLSLGRRVVDDGYALRSPAYSKEPILTHPNGEVIVLDVID